MPKGGGNKKGKQPAPKPQRKRPVPASVGGGASGSALDREAILAQVSTLERALGLGQGDKRARVTRRTAQDAFSSQMQQRLLAVGQAASVSVPAEVTVAHPEDVGLGQLVPVGLASTPTGSVGEYRGGTLPDSWPWGYRGAATSSGSLGARWRSGMVQLVSFPRLRMGVGTRLWAVPQGLRLLRGPKWGILLVSPALLGVPGYPRGLWGRVILDSQLLVRAFTGRCPDPAYFCGYRWVGPYCQGGVFPAG